MPTYCYEEAPHETAVFSEHNFEEIHLVSGLPCRGQITAGLDSFTHYMPIPDLNTNKMLFSTNVQGFAEPCIDLPADQIEAWDTAPDTSQSGCASLDPLANFS